MAINPIDILFGFIVLIGAGFSLFFICRSTGKVCKGLFRSYVKSVMLSILSVLGYTAVRIIRKSIEGAVPVELLFLNYVLITLSIYLFYKSSLAMGAISKAYGGW